jgi:DNA topoisomerase-1
MLIIVESPAKAKTISKIVGKNHTVKASVGHIRKISDDRKTKDGRKLEINGIDIDKKFTPIFEVDPGKKKVVSELKKLAKQLKMVSFLQLMKIEKGRRLVGILLRFSVLNLKM